MTAPDSNPALGQDIYVQNEVFCQTLNPTVQIVACASVSETLAFGGGELGNPASDHTAASGTGTGTCGSGTCPASRIFQFVLEAHDFGTAANCAIWAESVRDAVVLPPAPVQFNAPVVGTPHHNYAHPTCA